MNWFSLGRQQSRQGRRDRSARFILGGAVAHQVSAGFVPIRKKGKLPFKAVSVGYTLEYATAEIEMHEDAVLKDERVILVDDLDCDRGHCGSCLQAVAADGALNPRGLFHR